jgi:hypothetical protein
MQVLCKRQNCAVPNHFPSNRTNAVTFLCIILLLALSDTNWQLVASGRFGRLISKTICMGDWVGPRSGPNVVGGKKTAPVANQIPFL